MMQNVNGNEAGEFFFFEHDNRLNNAVCARATSCAAHTQPGKSLTVAKPFKVHSGARRILGHACGT